MKILALLFSIVLALPIAFKPTLGEAFEMGVGFTAGALTTQGIILYLCF